MPHSPTITTSSQAQADDAWEALRSILPASVGLALVDIAAPQPALWPEERPAIQRALPARIQEFTAGRAAARKAFASIGFSPSPVPVGPGRAPIWPHGICGSITHTQHVAAAIAARSTDWASIGLDLEIAKPLPAEIVELITADGDRMDRSVPDDLAATLLFSAKEAAFKAQFPLTGKWIDYCDVEMRIDSNSFHLNLNGFPISGFWRLIGDMLATGCLITPSIGDFVAQSPLGIHLVNSA